MADGSIDDLFSSDDPEDQSGQNPEGQPGSTPRGEGGKGEPGAPDPRQDSPEDETPLFDGGSTDGGVSSEQWARSGMVFHGRKGRYRLRSPLGSGGMGMVWKAEVMPEDGSETAEAAAGEFAGSWVAIKLVNPQSTSPFAPATITRRELAPLLALKGDRVVPILDWSLDGLHPFLAFQFMSFGSLENQIRHDVAGVGLSTEDLLQLAEHLLIAVSGAHRSSLLHLDIKPANILRDGQGGYLLADFGIAQESGEGNYQKIPGVGTQIYQAPEQADLDFEAFDQRTDLFGVGITIYAAAVARGHRELYEWREAGRKSEFAVPPLEEKRPDLPREFCAMVMEMLRNSRQGRPGHAGEVRERLRALRYGGRPAVQDQEDFAARRVDPFMALAVMDGLVSSAWRQLLLERGHSGVVLHYRSGEILAEEGAPTYSAFVLLSGRLEVVIQSGEICVGHVERVGEIVGEVAALTGQPRTASIRAVEDSYVLGFNAAEFEAFASSNPLVGLRLMRSLCERYLSACRERDLLRARLSDGG